MPPPRTFSINWSADWMSFMSRSEMLIRKSSRICPFCPSERPSRKYILPALPLDGGRVLQSALEARFPLEGEGYARRVSFAVGALLFLLGLYVLLQKGNPTLFSAGGVILLRSGAKRALHLPEKLLKYKFKL